MKILPIFSSSISSRDDELNRNCSFFKISFTIAVNASRYLDKTIAQSSTERVLANVPDTKSTHVHLKIVSNHWNLKIKSVLQKTNVDSI